MRNFHQAWLGALALPFALIGCTETEVPGADAGGGSPAVDAGGGSVGRSCGSRGQAPCSAGEFCDFPISAQCGEADLPGVCKVVKPGCTKEYNPVCGCDGQTYGNLCMANAASVSARSTGACAPTEGEGKTCGGIAGLQCGAGEFCSFPPGAQCGAADQTGTCAKRPEACIEIYKPVCGCDDKTYGNACAAASAGVSVLRDGEC